MQKETRNRHQVDSLAVLFWNNNVPWEDRTRTWPVYYVPFGSTGQETNMMKNGSSDSVSFHFGLLANLC